ncbi:MAG TPA: threonylcarbamoyl-AMP synthase [Bacteroidetes bacterium]|nr:threonylcarbamoyl-AMP synthase [Bacteroidota bacterium]
MILRVHPENPETHKIKIIAAAIKKGAVVIIPTDSVYALACDIKNKKAVERICILKGIKPSKANFSLLCADLSNLSDYTLNVSKNIFRILKKNLPGPFTFILNANNNVPKIFDNNKKTIGIRVPQNEISRSIINALGNPIVATSLNNNNDDIVGYLNDPDEIHDMFENRIDMIIDGGQGGITPSAVVFCTNNEIEVIREGKRSLIY